MSCCYRFLIPSWVGRIPFYNLIQSIYVQYFFQFTITCWIGYRQQLSCGLFDMSSNIDLWWGWSVEVKKKIKERLVGLQGGSTTWLLKGLSNQNHYVDGDKIMREWKIRGGVCFVKNNWSLSSYLKSQPLCKHLHLQWCWYCSNLLSLCWIERNSLGGGGKRKASRISTYHKWFSFQSTFCLWRRTYDLFEHIFER